MSPGSVREIVLASNAAGSGERGAAGAEALAEACPRLLSLQEPRP